MGLEYARQLAAQGYRLVLVSNRQDQLDAAEAELNVLAKTKMDAAEAELDALAGTGEAGPDTIVDRTAIKTLAGTGSGTAAAGTTVDGMTSDGLTSDGTAVAGMTADGITADGTTVGGGAEGRSAGEALESGTGRRVICRWADLTAEDAAEVLHGWCVAEGLLPDVLVCNAGMFFFGELSPEKTGTVQAMLDLHIRVNTRLCLLFGEEMKRRGSGRIIIVSSMAARLPVPGITIYSATKAYLLSFGKSLWFELKPYGVKVTTVCPAAIATPLYRLKPSLMELGVKLGVIHTPKWLVRRALRASERGRRVIRPSLMNAYLPALIALLPAPLEERIWRKLKG